MLTGIKSSDFNKSFGEDTVQLRATSCFSKKKKKTPDILFLKYVHNYPSWLQAFCTSPQYQKSFSPDLWVPSPPLLHQLAPLSITSQKFTSPLEFLCFILQIYPSFPFSIKKNLYFESICHVESAFAMTVTLLPFGSQVHGKLIKPVKLTLSAFLPRALVSQGIAEWKAAVCPWLWGRSCEPDKWSPWFHEEKTDTT